jgi:RNA polymerase sigma-70 factor (ECF subfamily)
MMLYFLMKTGGLGESQANEIAEGWHYRTRPGRVHLQPATNSCGHGNSGDEAMSYNANKRQRIPKHMASSDATSGNINVIWLARESTPMRAVQRVVFEREDHQNVGRNAGQDVGNAGGIVLPQREGEAECVRMNETQVDQLLVEQVQKGDKFAFDLLINKYQHRIVSLVTRYVHDHAEAQDVAQEAFIKAYRAIGSFRGDSAFYTWLYRIAINTAKNWLVAQKRRPPAYDIDAVDAEQYDVDSRLKDKATPENELLREEIKQTVYDTIEQLPEDLRTAIVLREMEGMSYEEIAATMECPIGTVRSRIFRAREAIDEKLRPLIEGN